MKVRVVLHSILREKLPPENRGQTILDLPEGSTLQDVMAALDLPETAVCAVNGILEKERMRVLHAGDEARFFRSSAGG